MRLSLCLFLALSILPGCKKEAPPATGAGEPTPTSGTGLSPTVDIPSPVPIPEGQPFLTILTPGAKPLEILIFHPTAGHLTRSTMVFDQAMQTRMFGTVVADMNSPPVHFTTENQVLAVGDSGFTHQSTFTAVEVLPDGGDPTVAATMQNILSGMIGVVITSELHQDGRTLSSQQTGGSLSPEIQDSLESMPSAMGLTLPPTPIGVGAIWSTTEHLNSNGVGLIQTTTYTLVAREGDLLTIDLVVTQQPDGHPLTMPQLPPGSTAKIDRMDSRGVGQTILHLQTLETHSTLDLDLDMTLTVAMGADSATVDQGMQMSMKVDTL